MLIKKGFVCKNCRSLVSTSGFIGTIHRNHCPFCLWSKHVDLERAGDRKASCGAKMMPIGLTFKKAGFDKYGKLRQGELMIIHRCTNEVCGQISINRIAGDDNPKIILKIFEKSLNLDDCLRSEIIKEGIDLLTEKDTEQIKTQLFGKS